MEGDQQPCSMPVTGHSYSRVPVDPRSWKCGWQDKPKSWNHQQDRKMHHDDACNHINTFLASYNALIHLPYIHSHFHYSHLWLYRTYHSPPFQIMTKRWCSPSPPPLPSDQGEADDLSMMRISMTISAQYPTIRMIVRMTVQNMMTSLFSDHPGKQWASGHQDITSSDHLENGSRQLSWVLHRFNLYILSIGRSIFSPRRRMNSSLRHRHPTWYPIECLNDWVRPLMFTFPRRRIQMTHVSNWLHGKLEICGDMSPVLERWQASSSAQNTTPGLPIQAFRRWSWHMWSL